MKKLKWSQQEEEYLKVLRQQKNLKSWKEISVQLSKHCKDSAKSSKQCRERYINYSRFVGSQKCQLNLFWSIEDDRVLAKLYNKYGSAWSSFTTSLTDKSQNSIKNRFYNRLKKFAKKLDDHRSTHSEQVRIKSSSYESMIRILDFSNQIKNLCENSKVDFNKETNMFTARDEILHLCFDYADDSEIPCEQYCRLSRKMKQINVKIRCFGICKAKNRKNWKLTQQGFLSSLGFEKTDLFNIKTQQPVQANVENSRNAKEAEIVNAQTINHQVIAAENQNVQEARQHYDHFHFLNPYMYLNPYNFFMVPPPYLLPMGQPVKLEEGGTNVRQAQVKRQQVVKRQDS